MLQYRTVVGPINTIDSDINHLASEGWTVQQMSCVGANDSDALDANGMPVFEVPVMAYLMVRETAEPSRPQRKVIGGQSL